GQPDLAAHQSATRSLAAAPPLVLHGVGVLDGHALVPGGEQRHGAAGLLGLGEFVRDGGDGLWSEHRSPALQRWGWWRLCRAEPGYGRADVGGPARFDRARWG